MDQYSLTAQVVPVEFQAVAFPVDGKLSDLMVVEGVRVAQGQIMAQLEMKTYTEQLAQAKITLEQAEDQLQEQERTRLYALERARLQLQLQQILLEKLRRSEAEARPLQMQQAENDLERARIALERAQSAYDAVAWKPGASALPQAAALQSATLEHQAVEARYRLQALGDGQSQIAQQEIQVKLAQLAVKELEDKVDPNLERNIAKATMQIQTLERQIEERRLRAPFDGQVVAIGINVEGLQSFSKRPKTGDSVPAYAPLVAVARPDRLELSVVSGSGRSAELTVGQTVSVTHTNSRNQPFAATVSAIPVKSLGSGLSVQTSGQTIRLTLHSPYPKMAIGDSVEVSVVGDLHPDTIWVPPAAIRRFSGRTFVVLQEEGRQRRADVSVGLENNEQVEILSGLKEGDVVVGP